MPKGLLLFHFQMSPSLPLSCPQYISKCFGSVYEKWRTHSPRTTTKIKESVSNCRNDFFKVKNLKYRLVSIYLLSSVHTKFMLVSVWYAFKTTYAILEWVSSCLWRLSTARPNFSFQWAFNWNTERFHSFPSIFPLKWILCQCFSYYCCLRLDCHRLRSHCH